VLVSAAPVCPCPRVYARVHVCALLSSRARVRSSALRPCVLLPALVCIRNVLVRTAPVRACTRVCTHVCPLVPRPCALVAVIGHLNFLHLFFFSSHVCSDMTSFTLLLRACQKGLGHRYRTAQARAPHPNVTRRRCTSTAVSVPVGTSRVVHPSAVPFAHARARIGARVCPISRPCAFFGARAPVSAPALLCGTYTSSAPRVLARVCPLHFSSADCLVKLRPAVGMLMVLLSAASVVRPLDHCAPLLATL
jgi:hypothetical protein